ncbi:alpha/beta hydrolase [Desulfococcaceae bacterium HSG8]|nr:alpha/beta hydrolase [Desulfococcaceae bacterium HSG8]
MNHSSQKMHNYLTICGNRLETEWHGPPPEEAPTLVFLHEGLGCIALWKDFPARLSAATGYGALVYSRSGYGHSDPCELPRPIRFMHDEGLDVLPELIRTAGIRECILIGHSDGGSVAIIYAGGTPAIPLRGLITEAAHVFCEEITVRSIQKAKSAYRDSNMRRKLEKYHGANTDCAFRGWNDVWLHPEFVHWNLEEYLPGIRVPMLVIQGEDDEYGTRAQPEAIVSQAGAGAELVMLPDCGHSPHRHQETATLEAMSCFISQVFDLR